MMHSFYVLTKQVSYKQLMHHDEDFTLIFNPTKAIVPMHDDTYDVLIEYFESIEDYEKCALLLKFKKEAVKNSESVWPLDQALYDE